LRCDFGHYTDESIAYVKVSRTYGVTPIPRPLSPTACGRRKGSKTAVITSAASCSFLRLLAIGGRLGWGSLRSPQQETFARDPCRFRPALFVVDAEAVGTGALAPTYTEGVARCGRSSFPSL